jgi:hypothetical protein
MSTGDDYSKNTASTNILRYSKMSALKKLILSLLQSITRDLTVLSIRKPGDKKHEPSKLNYYTFGDELTSLGVNSLSSPLQMDVVYKK